MSIISIQSQVTYGYAGNSAAVFPLQLMGFEVWAVNTVNFASHTGYGSPKGKVFDGAFINEIVSGLKELGVLDKTKALLSGYLGDISIADAVFNTAAEIFAINKDMVFLCDPVMGNKSTGFFVKEEISKIFIEKALSNATIMTPNHFELEILCGSKIKTEKETCEVLTSFIDKGLKCIVATSLLFDDNPKAITIMAADKNGVCKVTTPKIAIPFKLSGTGDVFASLFLGHYLKGTDLSVALSKTVASVFGIIEKTFACNREEIMLIEEQKELIKPSKRFKILSA